MQVATPDLKAAALSLRLRRKASTEDYKNQKMEERKQYNEER